MRSSGSIWPLVAFLALLLPSPAHAEALAERTATGLHRIANEHLERALSTEGEVLRTRSLRNFRDGATLVPSSCEEFRLVVSSLTGDTAATILTSTAFRVTETRHAVKEGVASITFNLVGREKPIRLEVVYSLASDEPFLRKRLSISADARLRLDRVDVESMTLEEAYQPYELRRITANAPGQWKPGLGQPLYTRRCGTFWGVEFPAAYNHVADSVLRCGYSWGREIAMGTTHRSFPAVFGVADHADLVEDAFFDYIDRIRVRPLRLQVQYNSWFDHGGGVSAEKMARSIERVHQELVVERGVPPLNAYVIDDGWMDTRDWSKDIWRVNGKFDPDFTRCREATARADSSLGLWLSPGCLFGAQGAIDSMRRAGMESIAPWMSMAGPKYMSRLEARLVDLTRQGVTYFKLDGLFGHLNVRNFELRGTAYGLPPTEGIVPDEWKGNEKLLDDPAYDEIKTIYLVAGTERLIQAFRAMAAERPEVYIVISNGAYLSPWWLQHVDSVWMINAGDAAGGSSRTEELVYRDARYYELAVEERTQFPLCALFNHEPKKTASDETKDSFRRYLYMSLSRGTGFVELYIKPFALESYDWDVLAEGLLWARSAFPAFRRARMHGGDPREGEVYGYTGWSETQGYVSLHNPSTETRSYSFTLDRRFGLHARSEIERTRFHVSSALPDATRGLARSHGHGDTLVVELAPREIRVLDFDVSPRDHSVLRALQTRTQEDHVEPEPVPLVGHPALGTWSYVHGGVPHTREITAAGLCTLRARGVVQWTKRITARTAREIIAEGGYVHRVEDDGTMRIEGRYDARRVKTEAP